MTIVTQIDRPSVATITLNRPDAGNRYDRTMLRQLHLTLRDLAEREKLRCVVIRGAGRHFCVGADVRQDHGGDGDEAAPDLTAVLLQLDRLPLPTIAVVQGACIGGGAAIAACCDVVLARSDAFFSIPEVRLGFPPSALMPFFIRAMGYRNFRRYAVTGERFDAATAERLGLVHQGIGDDEDAVLTGIVDAIRRGGPKAVAQTKQLAAAFATPPLDESQLRALETAFTAIRQSPEAIEGVASFRDKRNPEWFDDE